MRGENRLRRRQEIRAHFTFRRRQLQRPEGRPEDLRREIFGVGPVADPCVHQAVETLDVVAIDRLPVGIGIGVNHAEVGDAGFARGGGGVRWQTRVSEGFGAGNISS